MDFSLTDEQQRLRRRRSATSAGASAARQSSASGSPTATTEAHSAEIYSKMAELGWLGVTIDEQHGGSGGGMVDACLFMEETSRGLAPIGGYGTTLIVAGAVAALRHRRAEGQILGGIASGSVEAIAMTEPEAGSDVGSLTTTAERVNGGFVLNGPEGLLLQRPHLRPRAGRRPDDQGRVQARGPVDDLRPHRQPADGDQADRHARRPRDQLPLPRPTARRPRTPCSARSTTAGCS